jgi:hypothetical protein
LLCTVLAVPAALVSQQVIQPQSGGSKGWDNLPDHVRSQLWPERELSPVEQQLKDQVIILTDSLRRVDAIGVQIERNFRGAASIAMVRSNARELAAACARAGRTTEPAIAFAATLSTSDTKWGEPAVRGWRSGLADLARHLGTCEAKATAMVADSVVPSAERLAQVASQVGQGLVDYRRTEQALIATLRIEISPIRQSR